MTLSELETKALEYEFRTTLRSWFLEELENAGVENWEGYEEVIKNYKETLEEFVDSMKEWKDNGSI